MTHLKLVWFKAMVTTLETVLEMYIAACNDHLPCLSSVQSSRRTLQASTFSVREIIVMSHKTWQFTIQNSSDAEKCILGLKKEKHKHKNNFLRYWFLEMPLSHPSVLLRRMKVLQNCSLPQILKLDEKRTGTCHIPWALFPSSLASEDNFDI